MIKTHFIGMGAGVQALLARAGKACILSLNAGTRALKSLHSKTTGNLWLSV